MTSRRPARPRAEHVRSPPALRSAWERLAFRGAPRSARQRHTDVMRQIDRNEPVSGVQIVLPALVDDSKVATFQGASVSDHSIDLVELEGRRVLRIVDTENEAGAGLRPALDEPRRHTNASVAL